MKAREQLIHGGSEMLEIEEKHLKEIEFLLNQSLKGLHFLFEKNQIRDVLKKPTEHLNLFTKKNMGRIQSLLTKLIAEKSLNDKRNYLRRLDNENLEILLRTYFHIVDNTIMASLETTH